MSGHKRTINYVSLLEKATMGVLIGILKDIEKHASLPSRHYFYITFDTTHPDVVISDTLKQQYPHLMTIVLQRQFWDLHVEKNHFRVTLSFDHQPQELHIPFLSILRFSDPSVNFSLRFRSAKNQQEDKHFTLDSTTSRETPHISSESLDSLNLVVPFPKVGGNGAFHSVDDTPNAPESSPKESSKKDDLGLTSSAVFTDQPVKESDSQPSLSQKNDIDEDDDADDDVHDETDNERNDALGARLGENSAKKPNVVNLADFRANSNPEKTKD